MENNNPFFDKKLVVFFVVSFLFFWGWGKYIEHKYPKKAVAPIAAAVSQEQTVKPETQDVPPLKSTVATEVNQLEKLIEINLKDGSKLLLSNRGMGLKDVIFSQYKDQNGDPVRLASSESHYMFELRLTNEKSPVYFDIKRGQSDREFIGFAKTGNIQITRTMNINENGSIESQTNVENKGDSAVDGFIYLVDRLHEKKSGSMFFPSYDQQKAFVKTAVNKQEVVFTGAKDPSEINVSAASLVSVGSQYFTGAALDKSPVLADVRIVGQPATKEYFGEMKYSFVGGDKKTETKHVFFVGPKKVENLKSIDADLASIIDFGMLSVVAHPMLMVMKWFHSLIGNWGFAIVFLTLLVRFITLPFNVMSVRSMKAMQKIQPQMNLVREKYKDDPMTMNREVMALMKENKANPLGGCLPMLLQIPVFFALFRVIGSSVELYQSPFIFWIHDLSAHDPLYILPVAQGLTMFVQQKITPTTMDPAQAKVMQFIPLVFTAFMLNIPSGLSLYMCVSGLFGLIQQWYIMRESKA